MIYVGMLQEFSGIDTLGRAPVFHRLLDRGGGIDQSCTSCSVIALCRDRSERTAIHVKEDTRDGDIDGVGHFERDWRGIGRKQSSERRIFWNEPNS